MAVVQERPQGVIRGSPEAVCPLVLKSRCTIVPSSVERSRGCVCVCVTLTAFEGPGPRSLPLKPLAGVKTAHERHL